ncbi:MAG: PDZ domain-containing protein [Elusimicrobia bacterium]|nr:PDZ domain-containing protein [Elusimicrobiota bacterium]
MRLLIPAVSAACAAFLLAACAEQPMFASAPSPISAPVAAPQMVQAYQPSSAVSAPPPMPEQAPQAEAAPAAEAAAPAEAASAGAGLVGMKVGVVSGGVAVAAVIPGSSADQAGVQVGDLVLAVDGARTGPMTLAQIARRVRGPAGTSVTVTFQRGDGSPFDKVLVRRGADASVVAAAPATPVATVATPAPPPDDSDSETNAELDARLLP